MWGIVANGNREGGTVVPISRLQRSARRCGQVQRRTRAPRRPGCKSDSYVPAQEARASFPGFDASSRNLLNKVCFLLQDQLNIVQTF